MPRYLLHSKTGRAPLVSSPKHHLCDPALAARLLGTSAEGLADNDPEQVQLFAQLFESLAVLSCRVAAEVIGAKVSHLRTRRGERAVDVVIEDRNKRVVAIEVKVSPVIRDDDVKHLLWLQDKLGAKFAGGIVVHAGTQCYRRHDGIWVVPLVALA